MVRSASTVLDNNMIIISENITVSHYHGNRYCNSFIFIVSVGCHDPLQNESWGFLLFKQMLSHRLPKY